MKPNKSTAVTKNTTFQTCNFMVGPQIKSQFPHQMHTNYLPIQLLSTYKFTFQ